MNSPFHLTLATFLILVCTLKFGYSQIGGLNHKTRLFDNEIGLVDAVQKREVDSLIQWQERVILHTDKSRVSAGDPIFFKAYMMTGPNRLRVSVSGVLIVELVDNQGVVVLRQYHKIASGMADGTVIMPKKLNQSGYILRAYTRWMQNYGDLFYYTKHLTVSTDHNKNKTDELYASSVTFHPEGGNLINALPNRIIIKAMNENGSPTRIKGEIVNNTGTTTIPVSQYAEGLYSAAFKPEPGEAYQFKTSDGRKFDMPRALDDGYHLGVNNLDPLRIMVSIQTTSSSKNRQLNLKGEISGVTYFNKKLSMNKAHVKMEILKKDMPFGVLRISLYDDNQVWATRLVSVAGDNQLELNILPLGYDEEARDVAFKVTVKDVNGDPVITQLSLGATNMLDENVTQESSNRNDIFWTSTEKSNRQASYLADLQMIAKNGNYLDFYSTVSDNDIKFPFQEGLELIGYAYDLNNKLLRNKKIQVMAGAEEDILIKEEITGDNGLLRLTNLQLTGEGNMVFRTEGEDTKSRLVKFSQIANPSPKMTEVTDKKQNKRKKKGLVKPSIWQPIDTTNLIELDEVKIENKRVKKKSSPSRYGVRPTRVTIQNLERPKTIPQMLLNIPGLQISGIGSLRPRISLPKSAGKGPVLWVLDGFPLMQNTSLIDIISMVSAPDVERIEALFGPETAIYGARAAAGAFLIYTRTGADNSFISRKDAQLTYQGFHESFGFDAYRDESFKGRKYLANGQMTLFWNANLKTDENGEVIVRFKSAKDVEKIEVKARTITDKGEIGSAKLIF